MDETSCRQDAPPQAIHRTTAGTWASIGDITNPDPRPRLGLDPRPARPPSLSELTGHPRDLATASGYLHYVHTLREITVPDTGHLRLVFTIGRTTEGHLQTTAPVADPGGTR